MNSIDIRPIDIPFNIKVRELCKTCKRYGLKATCPPYIESISYYKKLMHTFSKCTIHYIKFDIDKDKTWVEQGKESSLELYKLLIKERARLMSDGHYFTLVFGAGSCKLCPTCTFPCKNPDKAIVPMEATGIDVVTLMKQHGINIEFPIKDTFYRIGIVLYD